MNVQRLCPVYKKWLQLNPSNARQHRYAMQAQTQQAHQQGRLDYARELGYQTFEAAKVILNALQPTSLQKVSVVQEDVLAFPLWECTYLLCLPKNIGSENLTLFC